MRILLYAALVGLLNGCAASIPTDVRAVSPNVKGFILPSICTNSVITEYGRATVVLPAGTYRPDFQAKEGVFYRAPLRLLFIIPSRVSPKGEKLDLKTKSTVAGGLLVPKSGLPASATSVWCEPLNGHGGGPRFYSLEDNVVVYPEK